MTSTTITPLSLSPFERPIVTPPPKKSVSFASSVEVMSNPSPLNPLLDRDETDAWKEELWYPQDDLTEFRSEARDLCRQMRLWSNNQHEKGRCLLAFDPETRGLEQRSCLERQRRKYLSNRFVLKAAWKLNNEPDKLAAVCHKINGWATEIAVEEGSRDFQRAYGDRKRSLSSGGSERRVRARC